MIVDREFMKLGGSVKWDRIWYGIEDMVQKSYQWYLIMQEGHIPAAEEKGGSNGIY